MQCQICQNQTNDKYCDNCKHIRNIYTIHKLLEKLPITEKINPSILITKNIKNIEEYDLEILHENNLLKKDKYNNYSWTTEDNIRQYLKKHDKTNKKLVIKTTKKKQAKKEKIPEITEVLNYIEKNYNITDTFDKDTLQQKLKLNKQTTNKIIKKLEDEQLIQKSFYGKYRLNYHQIIKYKKKHNIKEDKIQTLNNIQKTQNKTTIKTPQKTRKSPKKTGKKKNTKKTDAKPKINIKQLEKEEEIIPQLREYINNQLIILPKNVTQKDITQDEIYEDFKKTTQNKIKKEDFDKYFTQTINTYPHIRHNTQKDTTRYNIKYRKTPQIIQEKIQNNTQKFKHNPETKVQIKENKLEIKTQINKEELSILYNLLTYTHENIKEYSYNTNKDKIEIHITYDITDEDSKLWQNYLKSYNLYTDN